MRDKRDPQRAVNIVQKSGEGRSCGCRAASGPGDSGGRQGARALCEQRGSGWGGAGALCRWTPVVPMDWGGPSRRQGEPRGTTETVWFLRAGETLLECPCENQEVQVCFLGRPGNEMVFRL